MSPTTYAHGPAAPFMTSRLQAPATRPPSGLLLSRFALAAGLYSLATAAIVFVA